MTDQKLATAITTLLDTQVQAVLATSDGNQPCLHLMAYAFSPSLAKIYLATYANTQKAANMLNNPAVSLLWDNRTGNTDDHTEGFALTAIGLAKPQPDEQRQEARQLLLARNTSIQGLLDNPETLVFAIEVDHYRWVQGYDQVYRYQPTGQTA